MNTHLDKMGITASVACSIHCALHAFLPAALAFGLILGPLLEWTLTILAVCIAIAAGIVGLRLHGSSRLAGALFTFAGILVASRFLEELMPAAPVVELSTSAGIGLAITHIANLRACSRPHR